MSGKFFLAVGAAIWLLASNPAGAAEAQAPVPVPPAVEPGAPPPDAAKPQAACPGLHPQISKAVSPMVLIVDGPLPGPTVERAPSEHEVKCVEVLRLAGKKDIEEGRVPQGAEKFLSAVHLALPLAWVTYRDLAAVLDKTANPEPAIAAYRKAWAALEVDYGRPEAKIEGITVLAMADIRDSIVRLGGQPPKATTEMGRIVVASSTRKLQEQYFERANPVPPPVPPAK